MSEFPPTGDEETQLGPETPPPAEAETVMGAAESEEASESIGKYAVIRKLGQGGMGSVYLSQDPTLKRQVAIKTVVPAGAGSSADSRAALHERFLVEARAAASVDHPNIVKVYEGAFDGETPYIVMEYVKGRTLAALLRLQGALGVERAVDYALKVCGAMAAAHRAGLIHRDIKPANIMVTEDDQVKIMDFGLVKRQGSELTKTGQMMGTLNYMAPEQFVSARDVGKPADVFAFGAVLYEMLTGEKAFPGASVSVVSYKILNEPPVPPKVVNPAVPAALAEIVSRSMAKEIEQRFQSFDELLEALTRFREGSAARSTQPTRPAPVESSPEGGDGEVGPQVDLEDDLEERVHAIVRSPWVEGSILWSLGVLSVGLYYVFVAYHLTATTRRVLAPLLPPPGTGNAAAGRTSALLFGAIALIYAAGLAQGGQFVALVYDKPLGYEPLANALLLHSSATLWVAVVALLSLLLRDCRELDGLKLRLLRRGVALPAPWRIDTRHLHAYTASLQRLVAFAALFAVDIYVMVALERKVFAALDAMTITPADLLHWVGLMISFPLLLLLQGHFLFKDVVEGFVDGSDTATTDGEQRGRTTRAHLRVAGYWLMTLLNAAGLLWAYGIIHGDQFRAMLAF